LRKKEKEKERILKELNSSFPALLLTLTVDTALSPALTVNSRPSVALGVPLPTLDLAIPLVIPLRPLKTPHNVADVQSLVQGIKDGKISSTKGITKLAKATEFSLAKVVITTAQNEDLVSLADEKVKQKNK